MNKCIYDKYRKLIRVLQKEEGKTERGKRVKSQDGKNKDEKTERQKDRKTTIP